VGVHAITGESTVMVRIEPRWGIRREETSIVVGQFPIACTGTLSA
jgi:hypothetical protein